MKSILTLLLVTIPFSISAATFSEFMFANYSSHKKVVVDWRLKEVRVSYFENDIYTGKFERHSIEDFSSVTNLITEAGFRLVKKEHIDTAANNAAKINEMRKNAEKMAVIYAANYVAPTYYSRSSTSSSYTPSSSSKSSSQPKVTGNNNSNRQRIHHTATRDTLTPPTMTWGTGRK